jgi:ketosteroid isomerase-like protein
MSIYTNDAILVIEPGRNAIEKNEIRKVFEAITIYFKNGLQIEQNDLETRSQVSNIKPLCYNSDT